MLNKPFKKSSCKHGHLALVRVVLIKVPRSLGRSKRRTISFAKIRSGVPRTRHVHGHAWLRRARYIGGQAAGKTYCQWLKVFLSWQFGRLWAFWGGGPNCLREESCWRGLKQVTGRKLFCAAFVGFTGWLMFACASAEATLFIFLGEAAG